MEMATKHLKDITTGGKSIEKALLFKLEDVDFYGSAF